MSVFARIMKSIHETCVKYGREDGDYINYVKGANIGGFVKVADAMTCSRLQFSLVYSLNNIYRTYQHE